MKFNLKNHTPFENDEEIQYLEKREIVKAYEKWFEGFEKELREKLYPETGLCKESLCPICNHVRLENKWIKEILGK